MISQCAQLGKTAGNMALQWVYDLPNHRLLLSAIVGFQANHSVSYVKILVLLLHQWAYLACGVSIVCMFYSMMRPLMNLL